MTEHEPALEAQLPREPLGQVGGKRYEREVSLPWLASLDAHFKGAAGTGTRVEGRPCSLQFEKQ